MQLLEWIVKFAHQARVGLEANIQGPLVTPGRNFRAAHKCPLMSGADVHPYGWHGPDGEWLLGVDYRRSAVRPKCIQADLAAVLAPYLRRLSERADLLAADPSEFADAASRVAMQPATAACQGRRGSPCFQSIAMPTYVTATPSAFWATVAEHVSSQVGPAMKLSSRARGPVIAYLRDLEGIARRECDSRQIIQIIASGRHLLGDRTDIGPVDGPFSRT